MRKLSFLMLVLGFLLPASATERSATIAGYVRNAAGVPQMGAAVEVLGVASQTLRVFTDSKGQYFATGLLPGIYSLKVSAPSFLPTIREKIDLRSGSRLLVNVTLSTLFDSVQFLPAKGAADDDDWKWTLRSVANRPVLRIFDDHSLVMAKSNEDGASDHTMKAGVSFLAGSESQGYGSASDMSTGFRLEHSAFSSGTLALNGNVGYGSGAPTAVLRSSYSHKFANGSEPLIEVTARRLAAPDASLHASALQSIALTTSDTMTLGDVVELRFGSEMQTVQFMGRVNAFQPFGSMDLHLTPDTVVEYRYSSSLPTPYLEKSVDASTADLDTSGPRMSITEFSPALEKLHHQEVSVSHRMGKTNLQAAAFRDRVMDPALTGVGETGVENGEVLPDVYSGTFTYQGADLKTTGMRLVLQRKLSSDLTATLDYAYGGVLDLGRSDVALQQARQFMTVQRRHAVSGKLNGTLPRAKTRWVASYRWINGEALTPVDMFDMSAGQSDPYLNVVLRQPIPSLGFLPCKVEALVDLRNLLAQGYVPVMGQDGHTVYLVQSGRSVRGGLAFSF
jgi:Carboxypeptidase regulatory-like domain